MSYYTPYLRDMNWIKYKKKRQRIAQARRRAAVIKFFNWLKSL